MKQNVRTCRVIGAIVVGAVLGGVGTATTATAAPSIAVQVQGAPAVRSGGTFVADRAAPQGIGVGQQPGERATGEDRLSIKPVVDWVKRNAPSILSEMKNAVRSGWNSFKGWWNGLAGWIRASISAIAQMSLNEIFNSLWNYFFG